MAKEPRTMLELVTEFRGKIPTSRTLAKDARTFCDDVLNMSEAIAPPVDLRSEIARCLWMIETFNPDASMRERIGDLRRHLEEHTKHTELGSDHICARLGV